MAQKTSDLIAFDVEAWGPNPYTHGMASLGAASVDDILNTFYQEFKPYNTDPTVDSAAKIHGLDYNKLRREALSVAHGLECFSKWLRQFNRPVLIAKPLGFDYPFVKAGYDIVGSPNPVGFGSQTMDFRSYAAGILRCDLYRVNKKSVKNFLRKRFGDDVVHQFPHTHNAKDDAQELAHLIAWMNRALEEMRIEEKKLRALQNVVNQGQTQTELRRLADILDEKKARQ